MQPIIRHTQTPIVCTVENSAQIEMLAIQEEKTSINRDFLNVQNVLEKDQCSHATYPWRSTTTVTPYSVCQKQVKQRVNRNLC